MSYRPALSLDVLLGQLDKAAPTRSKASDGWLGDTAHASRTSDHNPWCDGAVVTARDFTHDPEAGADMNGWAEALRKSKDRRIKYVIWNKQMFSAYAASGYAAWTWRPYSGPNLHTVHMHLSVQCDNNKDSKSLWATPEGEWDEMATKDEIRAVVREEVQKAVHQLAVGKEENWNKNYMNLKNTEARLTAASKK